MGTKDELWGHGKRMILPPGFKVGCLIFWGSPALTFVAYPAP
jgi:hypothetical protein